MPYCQGHVAVRSMTPKALKATAKAPLEVENIVANLDLVYNCCFKMGRCHIAPGKCKIAVKHIFHEDWRNLLATDGGMNVATSKMESQITENKAKCICKGKRQGDRRKGELFVQGFTVLVHLFRSV